MNKINDLNDKNIFECCERVLSGNTDSVFDESTSNEVDSAIGWFCRGCSKSSHRMIPSVFRKNYDEHELYTEVLRTHLSSDFDGLSDLEILCKMQHYGVPTRLLDLTSSPLVSAFFALNSLESDGSISIDDVDRPKIIAAPVYESQYADFYSERVSILSSIPRLTLKEQNELLIDAMNDLMLQVFVNESKTKSRINSNLQWQEYNNFLRFAMYKLTHLINLNVDKIFATMRSKSELTENSDDVSDFKNDKIDDKKIYDLISEELNKEISYYYSYFNPNNLSEFSNTYFPIVFEIEISTDCKNYYSIHYFKINQNGFEVSHSKNGNNVDIDRTINIVVSKYDMNGINCFVYFKNSEILKSLSKINKFVDSNNLYPMLSLNDTYVSPFMEKLFRFVARKNFNVFRNTNPLDLINGVYVIPPRTNDRVAAQQGAFALFGLSRYWNIFKATDFFISQINNYEMVLNYVLKNNGFMLSDSNKDDSSGFLSLDESELYSLEKKVFDSEEKRFSSAVNSNLIQYLKWLSLSGINKKTLGCSLSSTSKNFLEQYEIKSISNKDCNNEQ